jgi:hypothetical protein
MSSSHRSSLRFGEVPEFVPFAFARRIDVTAPMTNAPQIVKSFKQQLSAKTLNRDAAAELAGTRMLIAEECFDALLKLMVDSNAVSRKSAATMLDDLSARLMMHSCGLVPTVWAIREPELLHHATRLAMKAERMRYARK